MSALRDFPGLATAEQQTDNAARILRGAIERLEGDVPEGGWSARAHQLRGIAIVLHAAALELACISGWNQAASAAAEAGVLDEESGDG